MYHLMRGMDGVTRAVVCILVKDANSGTAGGVYFASNGGKGHIGHHMVVDTSDVRISIRLFKDRYILSRKSAIRTTIY